MPHCCGKCLAATQCHRHTLDLVVGQMIKNKPSLRDVFVTVREIWKLLIESSGTYLYRHVQWVGRDQKVFSRHWSIKSDTWSSISDNHNELMKLWDYKEKDIKTKIQGVQAQMKMFYFEVRSFKTFYVAYSLCTLMLEETDNFSKPW